MGWRGTPISSTSTVVCRVCDEGLVAAALARPADLLGYQPDVGFFRLATAYAPSIAHNSTFINGNKRVAFVKAVTILLLYGLRLDAAEHMMLQLAAEEIDEEVFAAWLDRNTMPAG
ncbi:MAG: hypothetical protein WAS21_03705 [Geminicoccaceae bacterium]